MSSTSEAKAAVRVSMEEEGPVSRRLEIEVPESTVARAFDRAYRDLARRVRVRGFRPGKTPRGVLEKLYGPAVAEDLERTLVSESLPGAIRDAGLEPVAEPSVDARAPVPGQPFLYTARLEIRPEIELPVLEGLPAQRPKVEVTVTDVETELEELRQRQGSLVEEAPDTLAREGHVLSIDYEGRIGGKPFEEGQGADVDLELGSGRFLDGFEEQLVGARSGEAREVRVAFPEEGPPEHLAGQEAVFQVQIKALKRREVPELDDEFAKDVGDFESLEDLRVRIRSDLQEAREREAERVLHRTLVDALIERAPFEAPSSLVERQLERRLAQAHRELERSLPEDALHGQLARFREEWRPLAERELREELLLDAVARARDIEITDEEVDERLLAMAGGKAKEHKRLREAYEKGGVLPALRSALARERALDALGAEAKVEETTDT
jgi:trigger factor